MGAVAVVAACVWLVTALVRSHYRSRRHPIASSDKPRFFSSAIRPPAPLATVSRVPRSQRVLPLFRSAAVAAAAVAPVAGRSRGTPQQSDSGVRLLTPARRGKRSAAPSPLLSFSRGRSSRGGGEAGPSPVVVPRKLESGGGGQGGPQRSYVSYKPPSLNPLALPPPWQKLPHTRHESAKAETSTDVAVRTSGSRTRLVVPRPSPLTVPASQLRTRPATIALYASAESQLLVQTVRARQPPATLSGPVQAQLPPPLLQLRGGGDYTQQKQVAGPAPTPTEPEQSLRPTQQLQQLMQRPLRSKRTSGSARRRSAQALAAAVATAEAVEATLTPVSVAPPSLQQMLPSPSPATQLRRPVLVLPRTPAGRRIVTLGGGGGTLTPAVSRRYVTESDSLAKAWPSLAARATAAAPLTSRPSIEIDVSDEGVADDDSTASAGQSQFVGPGPSVATSAASALAAAAHPVRGEADSSATPALPSIDPSRLTVVPTASASVAEGSDPSTGSERPTPSPSHDAISIASRALAASLVASAAEVTVATSSPSQAQHRAMVAATAAAALAAVTAAAAAQQQRRATFLRRRFVTLSDSVDLAGSGAEASAARAVAGADIAAASASGIISPNALVPRPPPARRRQAVAAGVAASQHVPAAASPRVPGVNI